MTTHSPTVVVLHNGTPPPAMSGIERLADVRYTTEDGLADTLIDADVLFVWHFQTQALERAFDGTGTLRWIHAASAGVDKVMTPGITHSDVLVTNSRGIFDRPMAEYVLGTVLTFAKDLHTSLRLQDRKQWRHRETERIEGKSALIVGTGPIGRAIARQLTAAGLYVTGSGRTAREADPDFGTVHASEDLHDMVGTADYIVLAAPLTPQTRGMIDTTCLDHVKPTSRLINVGRGELVVQDDLIAALADGKIGGAALDVFETEPLPENSPLWDMPNVLLSPHMSGDTIGWTEELVELFEQNLTQYIADARLRNVVDKERGYVSGSERN